MKNPYLTVEGCVNRLYSQYKSHPRLIICCDYDDTLKSMREQYDCSDTINVLKRCQDHNFYIVIYTAAEPKRWPAMLEYAESLGIKVHAINKNPVELVVGNHGKLYYNVLLDDKSGLGQAIEILNKLIDKIELKEFYSQADRTTGN